MPFPRTWVEELLAEWTIPEGRWLLCLFDYTQDWEVMREDDSRPRLAQAGKRR